MPIKHRKLPPARPLSAGFDWPARLLTLFSSLETIRMQPPAPRTTHRRRSLPGIWPVAGWLGLMGMTGLMGLSWAGIANAADESHVPASPKMPAIVKIPLPARPVAQPGGEAEVAPPAGKASAETAKPAGSRAEQLREAIEKTNGAVPAARPASASRRAGATQPPEAATPQFTFKVAPDNKDTPAKRAAAKPAAEMAAAPRAVPAAVPDDEVSRQYIRARAAALGPFASTPSAAAAVGLGTSSRSPARSAASRAAAAGAPGGPPPWAYQGAGGPLSWGQLKPEFATCASGQRQSPIAIDDSTALLGPAEPLLIDYKPGGGSVVHSGRLLQVDVLGDNSLTVRGVRYRLERIEFHHPAEERINGRGFAMSAHLLHRSADGQLLTVAVLLDPGAASPLIDQVITYLPLDVEDRVDLPATGLDVGLLLPQDQRYYQFFGSLTTPPCTEDVLWIVFQQPATVSASQLKLFGQLFPNNTRPLQPANGRVVRAAQ
ncbi:MAG: hypothetical protein JWP29_4063 [Rhodoferax sp.]|nr:hypothetical protein [Rhodoferax sp.]